MTTTQEEAVGGPVVPEWTLADRLRKAREEAKMTQSELGNLLHVAKRTIVNYEQGRTQPNVWTLVGWARITNVDEQWLLGDEELGGAPRFRIGRFSFLAA